MLQLVYKTSGNTIIPHKPTFMLRSSSGNPPYQTGKLSPTHSTEGIPSAHDKSPTHTRPLSLLPPTATFTHRECLCVCACVMDSNL